MQVDISIPGYGSREVTLTFDLDVTDERFDGDIDIDDTNVYIYIGDRKSVGKAPYIAVCLELRGVFADDEEYIEVTAETEIPDIYSWDEVEFKFEIPHVPTFIGQPRAEEVEIPVKVKKLSLNLTESN